MFVLRIAICDDIQPMLDFISREVDEKFAQNGLKHNVETFISGGEFLESHRKNPFDIVFLDIVMPDIDGFQVAKKIRSIQAKTYIIFITTESGLVYDSLDFQPFHFIPKGSLSVVKERLGHVIDKLIIHLSANLKIELKMPYGETRYLNPMTICYVGSSANYVEFHLKNGETVKVRVKLDEMMDKLNPYLFARIHKRFVVNMKYIRRVDFPNSRVIMYDETYIGISRAHKSKFEDAYNIYLRSFE